MAGLKEGPDQLAFAADDHSGKSLEPFTVSHLGFCGQPDSQQPKLIHGNVAALDTRQQVRPQVPREMLAPDARYG